MAKARRTVQQPDVGAENTDQTDQGVSPVVNGTGEASSGAGGDKIAQAEAKLARMQETNKICFRHQNDLARIEEELLKRFQYSQGEMEYLMEPKGPKNIPGFGYSDIERQRQFVKYLQHHAAKRGGHAEQVDQSRLGDQEPQL